MKLLDTAMLGDWVQSVSQKTGIYLFSIFIILLFPHIYYIDFNISSRQNSKQNIAENFSWKVFLP